MRVATFLSILFLLMLAYSLESVAQEPVQIVPGERVRVLAPGISPDRVVGTVVSLDADTLMLKDGGQIAPSKIPLTSVTRLDVSRGHKSGAGKGALIGAIVGAAGGTVLGIVFYNHPGDEGKQSSPLIVVPALASLVGAGLGAIIGLPFKTERWKKVPLEQVRIGISSQGSREVKFSMSITI